MATLSSAINCRSPYSSSSPIFHRIYQQHQHVIVSLASPKPQFNKLSLHSNQPSFSITAAAAASQDVSAPVYNYNQEWKRWHVLDYGLDCKVNCSFKIKVNDDWMQIKLDMPGLILEDVTVLLEGPTRSTVRVIGQGKESPESDVGFVRQYTAVFGFPIGESEFLLEDYETDMDNGLLRLKIPRVNDHRWGYSIANPTGNGHISCTFSAKAATPEGQKEIIDMFKFESLQSDENGCPQFVHVNNCCEWEDEDKLIMWIDMPGLDPVHIQTIAKGDTMVIGGEGIESPGDDDQRVRRHASMFTLLQDEYDFDACKKEIKNGVLKVEVPKVKKEDKNAFNV